MPISSEKLMLMTLFFIWCVLISVSLTLVLISIILLMQERYRQDCNLAVQLLKCNKSHFRNHKFADVSSSNCFSVLKSKFCYLLTLMFVSIPSDFCKEQKLMLLSTLCEHHFSIQQKLITVVGFVLQKQLSIYSVPYIPSLLKPFYS